MLASICALAIYLKTVFLAVADSMRWDPIVGHHIFNCSDSISFFSVWLRPTNASSRDVTHHESAAACHWLIPLSTCSDAQSASG